MVSALGVVVPPGHRAHPPGCRKGWQLRGLIWVLWEFPITKESLFAQGHPLPEGTYMQWPVDVAQPPCFKAGQLWRALPAPQPLVGSAEAAVATTLQCCLSQSSLPHSSQILFLRAFLMTLPPTDVNLGVCFLGNPTYDNSFSPRFKIQDCHMCIYMKKENYKASGTKC